MIMNEELGRICKENHKRKLRIAGLLVDTQTETSET
jgi:hypothetical protein